MASKKGPESGVSVSGDTGLSTAQSSSPMLPQSSLVKAAKLRMTPMNLPPPPPLHKGFVPKQVVLEEPVAQEPG
jgi:hypothetical protein